MPEDLTRLALCIVSGVRFNPIPMNDEDYKLRAGLKGLAAMANPTPN